MPNNPQIKPDMLCYLRKPCFPQNIGVVVTTRRFLVEDEGVRYWVVDARTPLITSKGEYSMEGYVPEGSLVPINSPDLDVREVEQRLLPAPTPVTA